jgi:hypothetical protein
MRQPPRCSSRASSESGPSLSDDPSDGLHRGRDNPAFLLFGARTQRKIGLPGGSIPLILSPMFVVTKADAEAIRAIFNQEGELSAAIELRRRFPGITDNAKARQHARTIAGWKPLPTPVRPVTRLHPARNASPPVTPVSGNGDRVLG